MAISHIRLKLNFLIVSVSTVEDEEEEVIIIMETKSFLLLVKFTTPAHNIGTRDEYEMSSFRVSL